MRWEYKPGSELFFVWSQGNTSDAFNDLDSPGIKFTFQQCVFRWQYPKQYINKMDLPVFKIIKDDKFIQHPL